MIIDTTVTENNVTYPTYAKLLEKISIKLVDLAKKAGVELTQTYNQPEISSKISKIFSCKTNENGKSSYKKVPNYLGIVIRE